MNHRRQQPQTLQGEDDQIEFAPDLPFVASVIWPAILAAVEARSLPLAAVLEEATPRGVMDRVLTITFPENAAFHQQLVEDPKHTRTLQLAVHDVTGRWIQQIECVAELVWALAEKFAPAFASRPAQPLAESYYESDLWKRTRDLALEYYGDRCCLCNNPKQLNVHHRTYKRFREERLSDLIVLCRDCHAKYHGKAA